VFEGVHAEGGLGRVLRAYDTELGRVVAVKELLVPSPRAEARFVREAWITARLEHPAIVPVYDAGRFVEGDAFYSMQLIAGRSLKEVLSTRQSLRERLELLPNLLTIADAIAYAHSKRIIHRDLKPSNVIVGDFGETIVIDWGLAKDVSGADEEAPAAGPYRSNEASDAVTVDGEVVGTPAYMSPEQARGADVDEASDVYSLGAMLYHLLAGCPPYRGSTAEVLDQLGEGPPPPLRDREFALSDELLAIVGRAMARERDERYDGAGAFARDLQRYLDGQIVRAHTYSRLQLMRRWLTRHRSRLLAVTAAAAVAAGGIATYVGATRVASGLADLCSAAEDDMGVVWNADAKARIEKAFAASNVSFAADTWQRVESALDGYAADYAVARDQACTDTAELGRQSPEMFDRRISCLDDRVDAAAALIEVLAGANDDVVTNATRAVAALPRLAPCSDSEYLLATVRPPDDPEVARRVAELKPATQRSKALSDAGRAEASLALCRDKLPAARQTSYAPVVGALQWCIGSAERELGNYAAAAEALTDAYYSASSGGDDETAARSAAMLVALNAGSLNDHEASLRWQRDARAAVSRAAAPKHELTARLFTALGNHASHRGELKEAKAHFERALGEFEAEFGNDHPHVALTLTNLGIMASRLRHVGEAVELNRRAVAIFERVRGPSHPRTADALAALGTALLNVDELEEARRVQERVLEIRESTFGDAHPSVGRALADLGTSFAYAGDFDRSIELQQRALDVGRRAHGETHPAIIPLLADLGTTFHQVGRYEEAEPLYQEALALLEAQQPPNPERISILLSNYGALNNTLGRYDRAREVLDRALKVNIEAFGPDSPRLAATYSALGSLERDRGNFSQAEAFYERDREITEATHGADSLEMSTTLGNLAALANARGQLDEAIEIFETSVAIKEARLGPDHPSVGDAKLGLGASYKSVGRYEPAEDAYAEALRVLEKAYGKEHVSVGYVELNWGLLEIEVERPAVAARRLTRAAKILETALGPEHPHLGNAFAGLGRSRLALGERRAAVEMLRKALGIHQAAGGTPVALAGTQHALARALWHADATADERAEARALVKAALEAVAVEDGADGELRKRLRAWLRSHRA